MTFRQNICFHLQRYKILFIRKSFFHFFTTKKNGIKSGQLGLQCPGSPFFQCYFCLQSYNKFSNHQRINKKFSWIFGKIFVYLRHERKRKEENVFRLYENLVVASHHIFRCHLPDVLSSIDGDGVDGWLCCCYVGSIFVHPRLASRPFGLSSLSSRGKWPFLAPRNQFPEPLPLRL